MLIVTYHHNIILTYTRIVKKGKPFSRMVLKVEQPFGGSWYSIAEKKINPARSIAWRI